MVLQDDAFPATASVTICAFATHLVDAPLIRLAIEPSERDGLRPPSHLKVDKVTTVPRSRLESRIGRPADEDMVRLNRAVLVFAR